MSSIQLSTINSSTTGSAVPQVRACASFFYSNGAVNINTSYNIASIVRNTAGNFTVTFTKPLAANYVVTTGFTRASNTGDMVNVYLPSSTKVNLEFWSGSVTVDPPAYPGIMFTIVY